jgi:2-dehydropantoate 2-reductase
MERGREPAIDHINGEVVALGRAVGVATPYNAAAVSVVWSIFRREYSAGPEALSRVSALALEMCE